MSKKFGKSASSKDVAKQRLKILLIHDRNDFSPALVEAMRRDIVMALSKYVEIDTSSLEFELTRVQDKDEHSPASALVASIPIVSVKNMSIR